MKRRNILWIGISVLLVLGLLAGCKTAAPAPPAPKPATTAPPAPTTTAPAPTTPAAPTYTLKLGTGYSGTHIFMTAIREWIKAVEDGSKGRIKITLYEGGSLAPGNQLFDAVRSGQADIFFDTSSWHTGKVKEIESVSLTLDREPQAWKKAIVELNPILNTAHNKLGVEYFYPTSVHPYFLAATKVITKSDQLKGKMVRVSSGLLAEQALAIGGTPVSTAMGEIPDALAKGMVEAVWTSHRTYLSNKLERAAPYITWGKTMTNSDIGPYFNLAVWNSLPADLKDMIKKVSLDVAIRGIDRITADIDLWIKDVTALGVTLTEMPDDWKLTLKKVARDGYMKNEGEQFKQIWAIIDKYTLPKL